MKIKTIEIRTNGEAFYEITESIKKLMLDGDGLLHLFLPHTSCALCISEAFDPTAIGDVKKFFNYLVPRNLNFITHLTEGPDDSPSHMKSILLHQSLSLMVENGQLLLGKWQGIYLAEFRDQALTRKIHYKYLKDNV